MNSISVGEILRNNISNKNRLDIIVRLLYVECKYNENSYGVELYQKMQRIRWPRHFAKGMYEPKFNTLIDSFSKSGFIKDNPIILNANKKLVNGSHRLACCIYFNCDEITYIVEDKNPKYEFTWFKKNFSDDELEIILNRYNEILDRYKESNMNKNELRKEIDGMFFQKEQHFGRSLYYQSFDELDIKGQRNTTERISNYELGKYIKPEYSIINLGSNLGFLDVQISNLARRIVCVEYNGVLTDIQKKVVDFYNIDNIEIHNSKMQDFKTDEKFDIVMSLAVHMWFGYDNNEYFELLKSFVKPGGYVLLESQDVKKDADYFFITRLLEGPFSRVYEKQSNEKTDRGKIIKRKYSLWERKISKRKV